MKKFFKKSLAVILVLSMVLSFSTMCFAAEENEIVTTCDGNCGNVPTVIVPGLFQSETFLRDDNGEIVLDSEGERLSTLMVQISAGDIVKIIFKAAIPVVLSLVLQHDIGVSKVLPELLVGLFRANAKDNNGNHIYDVDVIRHPESLAACSEESKDHIYSNIPLESLSEKIGEDHVYFFAYDSFGSISDIADELYEFIVHVKEETGHDKVNLAPISQAGGPMNLLLERYKEELAPILNRVVYIIPAIDGADLLSKLFAGAFNKEDLYTTLLPSLFAEQQGLAYLLNIVLRILPRDMVYAIIDSTIQEVIDTLFVNNTCMWALVAKSDYDALHEKYLAPGEREPVRKEVEEYHTSAVNAVANVQYLLDNGVKVFNIAAYDLTFFPVFEGWDAVNSDAIIHLDSTTFGAKSAKVGESLPEDYVQANTYCTCEDGFNHMSPDRVVDTTTTILCETTFYFRYQAHEGIGRNDVALRLAVDLLTDENFTSVHTYPEKYPQFNEGRETKRLRRLLNEVRDYDTSALSAEDAAELKAAIEAADEMLARTVVNTAEDQAIQDRFINIIVKIGLRESEEPSDAAVKFGEIMKKISDWVNEVVGPRGFSDVLRFKHR